MPLTNEMVDDTENESSLSKIGELNMAATDNEKFSEVSNCYLLSFILAVIFGEEDVMI